MQAALRVGVDTSVVPLYGALPFKEQMAALKPADPGRRNVVLATSIAETSLTIPDVRVVVDGGLARRPRFDPGSGMTRLVTEKVSKAEAVQRQGRAGRVAPGRCYRHWTKGEEGALPAFAPVEIEDNDLMGLALELAIWGARDAGQLPFLTPPPEAALAEARVLLTQFGAFGPDGKITDHGRALAGLPLHPRLGQIVLRGRALGMGKTAPALAALLEERSTGVDLETELRRGDWLKRSSQARATLKRLGGGEDRGNASVGLLLSFGFPDRIARRRDGGGAKYLMTSGKSAVLPSGDLEPADWLVIADLDGVRRDGKIRRAALVSEQDLLAHHPAEKVDLCLWDRRQNAVVAERQTRLGAIVLARGEGAAGPDQIVAAMIEGVRTLGLSALPWTKETRQLQARAIWAAGSGMDVAEMSDAALMEELDVWLAPFLAGISSRKGLADLRLKDAIEARIGYENMNRLSTLAPVRFSAPTGSSFAIDYSGEVPKVSVRLQELLGITDHPKLGAARVPLLIELLSPAMRPIQTTSDLPGFWASSYKDVRKDMRGRYPKHVWPEDPAHASPTRRTKSTRA